MTSATFAPGHVFGQRYQVIDVLGVGHTAEVYLCVDETLHRNVVIKKLTPALEQFEDIRRTFRNRIVTAAQLSQPHLAQVFDGGQEDSHIYMVAEYLPTGSLEDELRKGMVLEPTQVARLGRDVALALAAMHEKGLIHGELSPTKLLFDGERRVRVSDVAMSGLGTPWRSYLTGDDVRYFAPEQAKGAVASAATDVYALAIILFEAATGTSPFGGFTAQATLRAREDNPLPSRPELGTIDMLLALASVPDPSARVSAAYLAERLSSVLADTEDFVLPETAPVTLLSGFSDAERRGGVGFVPPTPSDIVGERPATATVHDVFEYDVETPAIDVRIRRRRPGFLALAALLVVAAVGTGVAWLSGMFTPTHNLPSLENVAIANASSLLKGDDVTIRVAGYVYSTTVPAGSIAQQSPAANTQIAQGSTVSVYVSQGPRVVNVTVPHVVGMTCANALAALNTVHLHGSCPGVAQVVSAHVPKGDVVAYRVNGVLNSPTADQGSTILLNISRGSGVAPATTTTTVAAHGPRAVPNLVGDSPAQANAALSAAGLYYTTRGPGHNSPLWKRVVSSAPGAGTMVPWHSTIILKVDEQ